MMETVEMSLPPVIDAFIVRRPMVWEIIKDVAEHFDVTVENILCGDRRKAWKHARQIAMYLAHEHCGKSYPQLGREFNRDHSTVVYAVQKIGARVDTDALFARDMERILATTYRRQRTAPTAPDHAPVDEVENE